MEDRFEVYRFLQIDVEKQRLQQRGLREIGLLQKCLLESGSMEPSIVKLCATQIGPVKAGVGKIGGPKMSILEVSPSRFVR